MKRPHCMSSSNITRYSTLAFIPIKKKLGETRQKVVVKLSANIMT